ncbi:methylated-DNA--[protein]-cysteine S-methyltransferase [Paenibacillus tyrfis]|uniref:methylated-DNA--[protein]-cysteine S-methyltransferase n=1 Tax=Paenibacillus tyrfis TaxID=1501230 RepID=UPI000B58EE1D|nr:methylated-DNA--[protein]-cysteine S-methyltransferase [Paenibacillus tyrfis]
MAIRYDEMDSPIGVLTLGWNAEPQGGLCQIEFGAFADAEPKHRAWSDKWFGTGDWVRDPGALSEAAGQLRAYFAGTRRTFDLPLDLRGTPFQIQVWKALTDIPFGEVWSYKDVAVRIDSPKAVRAVGGANNRNPIPVIVPCHRVIGASGAMVGYGGGLHIKTFLLQHEGFSGKGALA